jgi:Holliday junction DNA helicase RuvA
MFYSLTGTVTHAAAGTVRLAVSGIEWELEASESSIRGLAGSPGPTRVFTYLYHREDALSLFGFATEEERGLFLQLIKVTGIGPKQAVRMLSGASPSAIRAAISSSDVDALSGLPGIGKKTAAKIVLALSGKLQAAEPATIGGTDATSEIVAGLVEMGFDRNSAAEAVRSAYAALVDDDGKDPKELENEVFRAAVVALSKKG